ncbi:MAG: ANTAR domain-containing protein [Bacillota bacterium]|nr:ANTAR domain-containing protein [Bacillota bacterium]
MRHLIIAFSDQKVAMTVRQVLVRQGHLVTASCVSGAQILQQASMIDEGGVVICPYRLIDLTAREIMHLLPDTFDMLVLVTPRQQGLLIDPGIYTLTQPINAQMLTDATRQLLETRQVITNRSSLIGQPRPAAVGSKADPAGKRTPEEQKIIEQAKYLLMNRRQCSEQEAHRYLQTKSMETGARLVDVAHWVIQPDRPTP